MLADTPEQIDLLVELTFHPQNTFIGVPAYEVRLLPVTAETKPVEPRDVMSVPRFGPRIEGMPLPYPYPMTSPGLPGGQPLTGGTIVMRLEGGRSTRTASTTSSCAEQGNELARTGWTGEGCG